MNGRHIAILIDGGFFAKRLPKLVSPAKCGTPEATVSCIRHLCRNHVKLLTGEQDARWHRHIYRIFYYDAVPYDGVAHHPFLNRQIDFGKSDLAHFRTRLFELLRRQRNVALRLGKVVRDGDWSIIGPQSRKSLASRQWFASLDIERIANDGILELTPEQRNSARRLHALWTTIENHQIKLGLRQKGVDMRIGLDIASITLKKQAETIVLVAGDSDFVPAAKLARREGVQFILDPLWQSVHDDLFEHIDGLQSGLSKPKAGRDDEAAEVRAGNEPGEPNDGA